MPSRGTRFQHCVAGVGSLTLGTNLILPGRGAPSGSATLFARICDFPGKPTLTPSPGCMQDLFLGTINFEVRLLKWHAAGRVSLSNNSKRNARRSGRAVAHRSHPTTSNATGNAKVCFFPADASPNSCRPPVTLVTAECWKSPLRSWTVNYQCLEQVTDSTSPK